MRFRSIGLFSVALLLLQIPAARSEAPAALTLGESTIHLNGPWRFRTGDDPSWADVAFDDSGWENVDLTPVRPDANDGDVGITPYVPGWTSKGHAGYQGYAWYRMHLTVASPAGETLAVLGPWAVDSAYQLYVNGRLLGSVGGFAGRAPTAHGYHYPGVFELPAEIANGGAMVIAIRAWMGAWALPQSGSGGIHVAPAIGERKAITAQYRLQWLRIFEGYAVDAVPALLFVVMVVMAFSLRLFDPADPAYSWLVVALVLSAIQRGNQAFFFWWEVETVQDFVYLIIALVGSLNLAAWIMAWRHWFKLETPARLPRIVGALTLTLIAVQVLSRPWLFHDALPPSLAIVARYLVRGVRLGFLLTFIWVVYQGVRRHAREAWFALPAAVAIGIVLFASELAAVHVPGIWFPWGVGLSLSEIASVGFDALLFVLLLRRLWSYARLIPGPPRQDGASFEPRRA